MAALAIRGPGLPQGITEIISVEENSTQVQLGFTDALAAEGLLETVTARQDRPSTRLPTTPIRPLLLAVSDNGPQMTSAVRGFMAHAMASGHAPAGAMPLIYELTDDRDLPEQARGESCLAAELRAPLQTDGPGGAGSRTANPAPDYRL